MTKYVLPVIGDQRTRHAIIRLLTEAGYDTIGAVTTVRRALKDMHSSHGDIALIVAAAEIPGEQLAGLNLYQMARGIARSPVSYNPFKGHKNTPFIILAYDPEQAEKKLESAHKKLRSERDVPHVPVLGVAALQTAEGCEQFLKIVKSYMNQ